MPIPWRLLALWNRSDSWYSAATQALKRVRTEKLEFLTTAYVLLECGNAAARTPFRHRVDELRRKLALGGDLIFPTDADWQTAWAAYRRGEANNAGVVDQISFNVMRRLGIRQAFTNDEHFRAAGFETMF